MLKTFVQQTGCIVTVALADAKTHKVLEWITSTREHPFYVKGKGFAPAGGLAVGNAIVTRAGTGLVVQSIKWNRRAEVYNFAIEDDHNYFVGTYGGGVWVHNQQVQRFHSWDLHFSRPPEGYNETFQLGDWQGRTVGEAIAEAKQLGRLPDGMKIEFGYFNSGSESIPTAANNRTLFVAQESGIFVDATFNQDALDRQFEIGVEKV